MNYSYSSESAFFNKNMCKKANKIINKRSLALISDIIQIPNQLYYNFLANIIFFNVQKYQKCKNWEPQKNFTQAEIIHTNC